MGSDKDLKREIRVDTGMGFGRNMPSPADVKSAIRQILESKLKQKRQSLDPNSKEKMIGDICDDLLGFGPVQPLLNDPEITEIMVNGPEKIYIEKSGRKSLSAQQFDDEAHLRAVVDKMLGLAGRRLDESSPYVDFSLKDGTRVNVIIAPLAIGGTTITIRKFLDSLQRLDDLRRLGTINEPMALFLRAAVQAKLNILFSGATGSGKTSTLGVLSGEIVPDERIITIEDALELKLSQHHVIRLLTRPSNIEGKGSIGVRQLFSNTLRMRPSRIILGEIRGEEALDFLQAINSGHDGTLAVLHAATPTDAIARLETMALYAGLDLPVSEIRRQIASGLQLIVQHQQLSDGSRKISHITELNGMRDGNVVLNDLFGYDIAEVRPDGRVVGSFRAINRPRDLSRFRNRGISVETNTWAGADGPK
jgi:pilus assembly protein CpaF